MGGTAIARGQAMPATAPSSGWTPRRQAISWAAVGALGLGCFLRVLLYAQHRSLELDEAMVALNVGTRGFAQLTHRLAFDQAAPVPFLWTLKLSTLAFGMNEMALRLAPLAASLGLLLGLWYVGRLLLGEREALIATVFASCSVLLVSYAALAKQYGVDGFVTVGLLALAMSFLVCARDDPWATPPHERMRWRLLLVGGVAGLAVAMPSVFVLAGIGAALLVDGRARHDRRQLRQALAVCVVWVAAFAALYLGVYRGVAHDPYLQRFWGPSFLRPGVGDFGRRVEAALYQAFVGPFMTDFDARRSGDATFLIPLGTLLYAAGVAVVWRRRGAPFGLLLLAPYAGAFAASALGCYPIAGRMLLFATPTLFLATACAVTAMLRLWSGPWQRMLYPGFLFVFLAARVPKALRLAPREDGRAYVRDLEARRAGSPVYILASGVPAWLFYTTDWRAPDTARIAWYARVASAGGPAFANAPPHPPLPPAVTDQLTYRYHGRTEIVGVGDGMEYRAEVRFDRQAPVPGWAGGEAERMRAAANPAVLLYASHFEPEEIRPLLAAIERRGGQIVVSRHTIAAAEYVAVFERQAIGPEFIDSRPGRVADESCLDRHRAGAPPRPCG